MAKLDIDVRIDLRKPQGKAGFGIPLILEEHSVTAKSYTECSSLADVISAGFGAETKSYIAARLMFSQPHAPQKLAVCAYAGKAAEFLAEAGNGEMGWRQLVVVNNSEESPTDIPGTIAAVEAMKDKVYFASIPTNSTENIISSGIERSLVLYYNPTDTVPVPEAALAGEAAGQLPGSFTYKNLILSGLEPQKLTDSEVEAIHTKGGLSFISKAGDGVTSEGKVLGGEYADIVDSKDYVVQQLAYRTQRLLNSSAKIPYDNTGIAQLESVAVSVMQEAFEMGIIAANQDGAPDYTVDYAMREEMSPEDRAKRVYPGGSFSFALAGAVHQGKITGEIVI